MKLFYTPTPTKKNLLEHTSELPVKCWQISKDRLVLHNQEFNELNQTLEQNVSKKT